MWCSPLEEKESIESSNLCFSILDDFEPFSDRLRQFFYPAFRTAALLGHSPAPFPPPPFAARRIARFFVLTAFSASACSPENCACKIGYKRRKSKNWANLASLGELLKLHGLLQPRFHGSNRVLQSFAHQRAVCAGLLRKLAPFLRQVCVVDVTGEEGDRFRFTACGGLLAPFLPSSVR